MEITKPNDILITTLNQPQLTPYDLLSNNINGTNTSLLSKEEYKQSPYVQKAFTGEDGKFNDVSFDQAYNLAQQNFFQLTNQEYLKGLDEIKYSPFDLTRPKFADTFKVSATMEKEYNPFKEKRGWTGIGSVDLSNLSLREIAQQGKIFDPETGKWSKESLNDLSLIDKVFGSTLVYAQYDTDGVHLDPNSGLMVNHKKGDWKVNSNGDLFIEKLGNREVYGKQVVNPMDTLTTDGSLMNKFDFLDSDGREKSITGTVFKTAISIAPFLIPEFGVLKGLYSIPSMYGGLKAAVTMAASLPTFFKSLEGLLLGDENTSFTKGMTQMENYFAKATQNSVSDEGSGSLFSAEQMSQMVGSIFSQIYEQRAMASLSKLVYGGDKLMNAKTTEMANKINQKLMLEALNGKIDPNEISALSKAAMEKIPELQSVIKAQSQLSKSLSLGYMALSSTSDIYGQALQGGYDRRTAGFAALAAAAGQYGIMMNNRMGDWFLDKTTGYSNETNRALMRKSFEPWYAEIAKGFETAGKDLKTGKKVLAGTFSKIKDSIIDTFTSPSVIAESMWKNAMIEGVEEVTEQMVLDATKGVVDTMGYLGLTKKKGSLGGWDTAFSKEGFENYLANFIGGVIGGGMFEFHRSKIAPWLDPNMLPPDTKKSIYELVAAGHKEDLIKMVNRERSKLGNKYITVMDENGNFQEVKPGDKSQADLIADKTIEMINVVDGILNSHDLIHSDEEIVSKAIMDHIIIKDLKSAAVEGSEIGLEGLVLEDYKRKMVKIGSIQSEITKLEATEGNEKAIKAHKEELKIYVDGINNIMEGKEGSKYYRQALLYLKKDIHSPFLKISKTDFVKETYGVNYYDLPEKGVGLTQERMNNEWMKFIESKDLRNDLEMADKVYTNIEQLLNKPISDYAATGYDQVRKETLKTVMDLKSTIHLFNTAQDLKERERVLNHFIDLNNKLEGQGIVAPWNVLHEDMFEQLDKLGLIKKVEYDTTDPVKITSSMSQFTKGELDETMGTTGVTRRDNIKNIVSKYFKQFTLNPLNAESTIEQMNTQMNSHNIAVLKEIKTLELLPNPTEEQLQKIQNLKDSMYDFRIDSILNTDTIKRIATTAQAEINAILEDKKITLEQFNKYLELKSNANLYKKNFATLLEEFEVKSWKDLDRVKLIEFVDKVTELGFLSLAMDKMSSISNNSAEVIGKALTQLSTENLTPENFKEAQDILEPFLNTIENLMNEGYEITNNKDMATIEKEVNKITSEMETHINEVKPDILKIHNYALDLLIKALSSGNADKEVFYEAEKLTNEEIIKVISAVFPKVKNLSYTNFTSFISELPKLIEKIEGIAELEEAQQSVKYSTDDTLESIIKKEEEGYATDINYKGFFPSKEFMEFVKNNFDGSLSLDMLSGEFSQSLEMLASQKKNIERIDKFFNLVSKGLNLKSNTLYDFIRKFELTLDSNPNSKINKILELIEREETNLKSSSNITNFASDNIREQDLNQAINHLEMMKAVVKAMSTTEVNFGDPYGFIQSRINYAKKYNQEDDVLKLKTITSDVANLMVQDLDALITKMRFLKDLALFNAGKVMNEQEDIRVKVDEILLANWKQWMTKMNPSFLPLDKLKQIIASSDSNAKKVVDIEAAVFDHNTGKKEDALEEFLKHLTNVNPDRFSQIDKDVKVLENWDLAVYAATVLASKSTDFQARNFATIKGDFTKAPFFTQEFAARIIKASTVNPLLFAKIYAIKKNAIKTSADFVTIILGGAGTGKTSATFGLALDNFRQTNEITNIWITAPTDLQVSNLREAVENSVGKEKITSVEGTKFEVFEKLGITQLATDIENEIQNLGNPNYTKKYIVLRDGMIHLTDEILNNEWIESLVGEKLKNLPNLLLIDEVTHFSEFEMYLLNAISRYSYSNDGLTFMKVIAAGDPTQLGYLAEIEGKYYNYNIGSTNAIFTPRLWTSIRSSNNQKRLNNDRYIRIVRELENIYDKHIEADDVDYEKAKSDSLAYLETNKTLNTLSYHQSSTEIAGDRIVTALDKEIVTIIANKLKEDPKKTIGVLTEDGRIPEEWNKLFSDAGITDPSTMSRIRTFKVNNVQGSEVDYFIFDAKLINKFDKVRDNLKALYTFMSRSKIASIIVDKDNILSQFNIANGRMDAYSTPFDFMTKEVIDKAKKQRSDDIEKILGENPVPSASDNFKWKVGVVAKEGEETIEKSWFVQDQLPNIDMGVPTTGDAEKELEKKALKDGFKILGHSFYNNPGVIFSDNGDKITVDSDNPPFDLNVTKNLEGKELKKTIRDWARLKNYLLHHNTANSIISTDYETFLKNAFSDIESGENIKVERVLTVTAYNSDINNAYKKQGFDKDSALKTGQLFINLSAKLTFGQKTHYITLATFGTKEKILEKAKEYNVDSDAIKNKYKEIERLLAKSSDKLLVLKIKDPNAISFFTGTRLEKVMDGKKQKKHTLSSLKDEFPGMNVSNIKFFPSDFQAFKNLISKYTFGEVRSEETLRWMFEGKKVTGKDSKGEDIVVRLKTEDGKDYSGLKNKPYIIVSYNDDLEGTTGNATHAKLVPIGSDKRSLIKLTEEVNKLLDERQAEVKKNFGTGVFLSPEMNTKTEILLNRSDILDVLIKWGSTESEKGSSETLLDLLFKEITFSVSDEVTGNKTSVFEIFNRFKSSETTETDIALKQVINHIKDAIKKSNGKIDAKEIKSSLLNTLSGIKGWHWTFFNIFAYDKILSAANTNELLELAFQGQLTDKTIDVFNNSKGGKEMRTILEKLMSSISGKEFYYSIPIKPAIVTGGPVQANSFVSGQNGFTEENFGDKFYINVTPESGRMLIDVNAFLDSEIIDETLNKNGPVRTEPEIKEEVKEEPKSKKKTKSETKSESKEEMSNVDKTLWAKDLYKDLITGKPITAFTIEEQSILGNEKFLTDDAKVLINTEMFDKQDQREILIINGKKGIAFYNDSDNEIYFQEYDEAGNHKQGKPWAWTKEMYTNFGGKYLLQYINPTVATKGTISVNGMKVTMERVPGEVDLTGYSRDTNLTTMPEFARFLKNWNPDFVAQNLLNFNGQFLFNYEGRVFVLLKVGNFAVPYYFSSSGTSGKAIDWHYVFGVDDKMGWIIKGGVNDKTKEMIFPKQLMEKYPNAIAELERLKKEVRTNLAMTTQQRDAIITEFANQFYNKSEKYSKSLTSIYKDLDVVEGSSPNGVITGDNYTYLLNMTLAMTGLDKTEVDKPIDNETIILNVVSLFEDEERKEAVRDLLTAIEPLFGDSFKSKIESIITESFIELLEKPKGEELVSALGFEYSKTKMVNLKNIGEVLQTTDFNVLKNVKDKLQSLLKYC